MLEESKEKTVEKTPEELKAEKSKAFYENPDNFVAMKDLVMGAIVTPKGPATILNVAPTLTYHAALGELQHRVCMELMRRSAVEMKKNQSRIVTPEQNRSGLKRFLRNK